MSHITKSLRFSDMLSDDKRMKRAFMETKGRSLVKIRNNEELGELVREIYGSLSDIGYNCNAPSSSFHRMKNGRWAALHKDVLHVNEMFRDSECLGLYITIVHEIIHTSGEMDETAVELKAADACAGISLIGDKRPEADVYGTVMGWIDMAAQLKARKEKLSRYEKEAFEEITHIPTRRMKTPMELYEPSYSSFINNKYTHIHEGTECSHNYLGDSSLESYGLKAYVALKKSIDAGKNMHMINGKEISIENLSRLLEV